MTGDDRALSARRAKRMGAYYTDRSVAAFLVRWAVRNAGDHVLDPSFGDGVFLEAAGARITSLGGDAGRQVHGVELDPGAYRAAQGMLEQRGIQPGANLACGDFFDFAPGRRYDCVVGNPPFIRYQRFSGEGRKKALQCAAALGVPLPALSSSWAPFLVKSASHLVQGGRLAMVAPLELGHASYGQPVLHHLHRSFGRVTFLTFERRLFPALSEDTLLVLAEGYGSPSGEFRWLDLGGPESLARHASSDVLLDASQALETGAMLRGDRRLLHHLLDRDTLDLYTKLQRHSGTRRLRELADVGIGYVTGANDFFHLSPDAARRFAIDDRYLVRAVRRGKSLRGIVYTVADWSEGLDSEESGLLLRIPPGSSLTDGVAAYLERGVQAGIPDRYKCRIRQDWYAVPHVHEPRAFLTYMSGRVPRLVANQARAVATNSLHVLRALPGVSVNPEELALRWCTSLTWLSAELEGHPMGGGMLKLEPGEAGRVVLAPAPVSPHRMAPLVHLADALVRQGDFEGAARHVDLELLEMGLGLSREDCERLRAGAVRMQRRRCGGRVEGGNWREQVGWRGPRGESNEHEPPRRQERKGNLETRRKKELGTVTERNRQDAKVSAQ